LHAVIGYWIALCNLAVERRYSLDETGKETP
jgi:hypothetical protein